MNLPNRDEIKLWIKTSTAGRDWLAEECGVVKTTIDKWLSNKEIPIAQHYKIAGLMNPPKKVEIETSAIRVPLTDEVLKIAHAASFIVRSDLQDFCAKAIRHRGEEIIKMNMEAKDKQIDPTEEAELERKEHGGDASTRPA